MPLCQKYIYHIENIDQYWEYERTQELRSKIYTYLYENFDLISKDDFDRFVSIQDRAEKLITSWKYTGKNYDLLCSIYVSMELNESRMMLLGVDTVLVEDVSNDDKVDLYVYSYSLDSFTLLHENIEKVGESPYIYISPWQDLSDYSSEFQNAAQVIYEKNWEGDFSYITKMVEQDNKIILSYIANRIPPEEWKYGFIWGIWIYENWDFTFLSEWDLARPNGDVDTFQTRYIVDNESIIVEWRFCGYNGWTFELKNGSDILHNIEY